MLTLRQDRSAFFFQEGLLVQDLLELFAVGSRIVGGLLLILDFCAKQKIVQRDAKAICQFNGKLD